MNDVIVTIEAEREAEEAFHWFWKRSPNAALGFFNRLEECYQRIASDPQCHPIFLGRHRYQKLKRYRHIVVFEIRDQRPWIIAVGHTSRSKRYWKRRLK